MVESPSPAAALALAAAVLAALLAGCSGDATGTGETLAAPPAAGLGSVQGIVVDDAIRPLPGVQVRTAQGGRSAQTDADGRFLLADLQPGAYLLLANHTGFAATQLLVQVQEGEVAQVRLTLAQVPSNAPYHKTERFRGYTDLSAGILTPVLDSLGAQPVPCACTFDLYPDRAASALVLEATWSDTLADPSGPTEYVYRVVPQGTNGTAAGQMADPLVKSLNRLDFGDETFSFSDVTSFRISIYPDSTWPAATQEYTALATLWYGERPPAGWSLLNGDA